MVCDIILTKSNNKFIARAKEWPEVVVEEDTCEKVLNRIQIRLTDYLANQIEVVQVEIPLPTMTNNPWIENFGRFKDDPTFDDLQAEIAAYRHEVDQAVSSHMRSFQNKYNLRRALRPKGIQ